MLKMQCKRQQPFLRHRIDRRQVLGGIGGVSVLCLLGILGAANPCDARGPNPHGSKRAVVYDPSHDIWQHTDPISVIQQTDMNRLQRIHVKSTRNNPDPFWGNMYPMQEVKAEWAEKLGIPYSTNPWDRHHYEATLPGFGLGDSMDWRAFINVLKDRGFSGPFEIENEAVLSKQTGNIGAIVQGCKAAVQNLAPLLYELGDEGWQYPQSEYKTLLEVNRKDIPLMTMEKL